MHDMRMRVRVFLYYDVFCFLKKEALKFDFGMLCFSVKIHQKKHFFPVRNFSFADFYVFAETLIKKNIIFRKLNIKAFRNIIVTYGT